MAVQDLARIEEKLDRTAAGAVVISDTVGGILFQNMAEVMEFAKLMSLSQTAVPKHLRGNPGACLAVCIQALEWKSSPFAVANKSYEVNDRIAYEAQLIAAIVNARAPLKERLRYHYDGVGTDMQCTISGTFKGEVTALEYESPKIKDIKVKNSPLWTSDPKQQLGYYCIRAWARRHCPEVILGIYSEDELEALEIGADHARDVTPRPNIAERLGKRMGARGFDHEGIEKALNHKPGVTLPEGDAPKPEAVTVNALAAEQQMTMSAAAGDAATEIKAKIAAIDVCDSAADVNTLLEGGREFLKGKGRGDLLGELMSAADKRLKKVKV